MQQSFVSWLASPPEPSWGLEILKASPSAIVALIIGLCTVWVARKQYLLAKKEKDLTGDARYLAIRILCILYPYIDQCASVSGNHRRHDEDGFEPRPDTPVYPDDLSWKSIDANLMYSILSLRVAADRADSLMKAVANNCHGPDEDEYFRERDRQYTRLGLRALKIAQALREKYGASLDVDRHPYWNPIEKLQEEQARQKQEDKEREVEHKRQIDLTP